MKKRVVGILFFIFLFFVSLVQGTSLQDQISLTTDEICGVFPQEATFTVTSLLNVGVMNFSDLNITLKTNSSDINLITDPTISLGPLDVDNYSNSQPSWTFSCLGSKAGIYELSLDYFADGFSEEGANKAFITIHDVDNTTPVIVSHSPDGLIHDQFTIVSIETSEEASCRYSELPGDTFNQMTNSFKTLDERSHKFTVNHLSEGFHFYYARCKDKVGNIGGEYIIKFEVDKSPTGEVGLAAQSNRLKTGIYKVILETNEDVRQTPYLSFSFPGSNKKDIPLVGSMTRWTGFLEIPDGLGQGIGTFFFEGNDFSDNVGSVLLKGKTFIFDTLAPNQPTNFFLSRNAQNGVELTWELKDEDIDYFVIYRAFENKEFKRLVKQEGNFYRDLATKKSGTYSYKIKAFDFAGNEGDFSLIKEIEIPSLIERNDSVKTVEEDGNNSYNRDGAIIANIDGLKEKIGNIQQLIFNLSESKSLLEEELPEGKINLDNIFSNQREKLAELNSELNKIETKKKDESTVKVYEEIYEKLKTIKSKIPQKIIFYEKEIVSVTPSKEGIFDFLKHFFKKEEKIDFKELTDKIFMFQKKLTINIGKQKVIFDYLDGSSVEKIFIEKVITGGSLENAVVFEKIPAILKGNVEFGVLSKGITIRDNYFELKSESDKEIRYSYLINTNGEEYNEIQTIIIEDLNGLKESKQTNNLLTGFVIAKNVGDIETLDFLLYGGIIFIIFLVGYLFLPTKKKRRKRKKELVKDLVIKKEIPKKKWNSFFPSFLGKKKQKNIARNPYPYPDFSKSKKERNVFVEKQINEVNEAIYGHDLDLSMRRYYVIKANRESILSKRLSFPNFKLVQIHKKICLLIKLRQLKEYYQDPLIKINIIKDMNKLKKSIRKSDKKDRIFIAEVFEKQKKYLSD